MGNTRFDFQSTVGQASRACTALIPAIWTPVSASSSRFRSAGTLTIGLGASRRIVQLNACGELPTWPSPSVTIFGHSPYCTRTRSEEHTSELQSRLHLVCRLLLEKKNNI